MPPRVYTRTEWGARPPTRIFLFDQPVIEEWVHHAAGPYPGSVSAAMSTVRAIQSYHMNVKGWSDLAYNFLVSPQGDVFEGRGINRIGGGTGAPYDQRSMSVCVLGNYERDRLSGAALEALRWVLHEHIPSTHSRATERIGYDRQVNGTLCPGQNIIRQWSEITRPWSPPAPPPTGGTMRGHLDIAEGLQGKVRVAGWAADEDVPAQSIAVSIIMDDVQVRQVIADKVRKDVNSIGIPGNHGYDVTFPAEPGRHTISVWGINAPGTPGNLVTQLGNSPKVVDVEPAPDEHEPDYHVIRQHTEAAMAELNAILGELDG